ncbi:hypothetical protein [Amycolatopsis arida]|nr:hypothetical protein [Amycolatopsis arida]
MRAFTGAVLGVFGSAIIDGELTVDTYLAAIDRALDFLSRGMPLTKNV